MYTVVAFYAFADWPEFATHREPLLDACRDNDVKGSILIAPEGINGALAGAEHGVRETLDAIRAIPQFADLDVKVSYAETNPFHRFKVRLKNEIVPLGIEDLSVGATGTYVEPDEWNDLIADPDVVLLDVRNVYEVAIGSFPGAIDPEIESFRELPNWMETAAELGGKPKVAMFCTGGIRCEKASAYLKQRGFDEVYQLRGGILGYLEAVLQPESTWQGDCYVFDGRVSVDHALAPGDYEACPNCNRALDSDDRRLEGHRRGVCCAECSGTIPPERAARFAERQLQIELAEARGEMHLGRTTDVAG